ncbi:polyisoprenoid diphosphate/phosphate phosphohydrolase PLPP6-like [Apostichopus japonicus]|uniref:polyisoprenoid diphosphate/phosphate phosphohydrolase PLPP6-like n=1 Tax=Stichopus japonicus TaxID=307972 RepID=UPI003AB78A6F
MVAAKTNKTRTAYGQAEPPGSPVKKLPLYKQLLSLDRDLAMICSVSADENSSLANLRPFLKLLEYSGHGIPWLLGVFVVMYLTNEKDPKLFQIAFNILFALVLDLVVSGTLKAIVRRPRPSTNSSSDMFFVVSVDHFSFPSGHTTRATMLAVLVLIRLPLSVLTQYLSIVWAFCIAASRVMLGRHHLSDVFFGAIIGYVQALAVQHYWFEVNDVDGILQLFKLWKS